MTIEEMIRTYQAINPDCDSHIEAWQFGAEPDQLAQLVLDGKKTATASAYDEYLLHDEPLVKVGDHSIILNSQDDPVCMIRTTKVTVVPFKEVSAEHADKEGEGDRSLAYWRQVHWDLFSQWLKNGQLTFTENSLVVCEEFEVVYRPEGV
ncbi:ASCH domain-containing protein [Streptococcus sp. sy010]|uniref:ASCH domain-containing protein n=1 Tax=Streptococcus sp. sy010 TaxID=2600148 RepID=UPI0011B644D9|nr:ASCH domain-containing protein [Streptococcus sp. sy010]TWT14689.1 ASCH domain-containing protein [Streptococcus sp. sy010]